jgi:hypothetical protein
MKNCSSCGTVNEDKANFCQKCGGKLNAEATPPPAVISAEAAGPRFSTLKANPKTTQENSCAVCSGGFQVGEEILRCDNCGKYYHQRCKDQAGGCVSPECKTEELKTCPFCAEKIKKSAIKCRFCGQIIDKNFSGLQYQAPAGHPGSPLYKASDYKIGSIGTYGILFGIGILLILIGIAVGVETAEAGVSMVSIGIIILIAAQIYVLVLLYQIWKYVIGESFRYGLRPSIDSPGKAIGYIFIPFYNIYWMFIVYGKFARDCNAVAQAKGKTGILTDGVGQAIPILILINFFLSWIPIIGVIITLIIFILEIVFFSSSIRQCKELRDAQ